MPGAGVSSYDKYTCLGGKTRTSLPPSERLEVLSTLMPGHRLLFSKLNSEQIDMVLFLLTGQGPSVKLARAGIGNRQQLCATLAPKILTKTQGGTTSMTQMEVCGLLEADEFAVLERKAVSRGYKQHTTAVHAQNDDNSMQKATHAIMKLAKRLQSQCPALMRDASPCGPGDPSTPQRNRLKTGWGQHASPWSAATDWS